MSHGGVEDMEGAAGKGCRSLIVAALQLIPDLRCTAAINLQHIHCMNFPELQRGWNVLVLSLANPPAMLLPSC